MLKYILWHMSSKTTILIKTDKKIKADAQKAARDIGVPLATVLGMYLRKFAREKRIEFEVLTPNAKTARHLRTSQKEFERGEYNGPFSSLDELFTSLTK